VKSVSEILEVALGKGLAAEVKTNVTHESKPCCGNGPFVNASEQTICLELDIWVGLGFGGKAGILGARLGLLYKAFGVEVQKRFCVTIDCHDNSCEFMTEDTFSVTVNNEISAALWGWRASIGTRASIGLSLKFSVDVCAGTASVALGWSGEVDIQGGAGFVAPLGVGTTVEGSLLPDGKSVQPTFRPLLERELVF
jgi:hypothetical protein